MSKQGAEQGSIPRLRFPGFEGNWNSHSTRSLYAFKTTNTLSRDKLNYEHGVVRNIHYGDIHTKFASRFVLNEESVPYVNNGEIPSGFDADSFCVAGDMVFADASEDIDDIGKCIEIIDVGNERVAAGLHTILARRTGSELIIGFGAYLFDSAAVRSQIMREGQGAKVLGISSKRLGDVLLRHPVKHEEQRKIADCMSSLDARIRAEIRKRDALKAHKQSLMQQLFPAEGRQTPCYRFPRFRTSGSWIRRKLSSLVTKYVNPVEVALNGVYRQIGIRSHGKGIFHKNLVSGESLGNKRVFWVPERALVVNIVFAWEQAVAVTSMTERGMIASHRFPMYTELPDGADVDFLKYFFLTGKGKELLGVASPGGAGRNKTLGQKDFENLDLLLPKTIEEQRAIASFLSTIDGHISLQSQKIAKLHQHKKGLMQGLFPAVAA